MSDSRICDLAVICSSWMEHMDLSLTTYSVEMKIVVCPQEDDRAFLLLDMHDKPQPLCLQHGCYLCDMLLVRFSSNLIEEQTNAHCRWERKLNHELMLVPVDSLIIFCAVFHLYFLHKLLFFEKPTPPPVVFVIHSDDKSRLNAASSSRRKKSGDLPFLQQIWT
jgi:hypothetical protein